MESVLTASNENFVEHWECIAVSPLNSINSHIHCNIGTMWHECRRDITLALFSVLHHSYHCLQSTASNDSCGGATIMELWWSNNNCSGGLGTRLTSLNALLKKTCWTTTQPYLILETNHLYKFKLTTSSFLKTPIQPTFIMLSIILLHALLWRLSLVKHCSSSCSCWYLSTSYNIYLLAIWECNMLN